jgi:hypothetical protein
MEPGTAGIDVHMTADSVAYEAAVIEVLNWQSSAPIASATDEKPLPYRVTETPPSIIPRAGDNDETTGAGRYVNSTPDRENC